MTEALKEIAKFAVEKGPKIGHYCLEQKLAKVGVCNVLPFENTGLHDFINVIGLFTQSYMNVLLYIYLSICFFRLNSYLSM